MITTRSLTSSLEPVLAAQSARPAHMAKTGRARAAKTKSSGDRAATSINTDDIRSNINSVA